MKTFLLNFSQPSRIVKRWRRVQAVSQSAAIETALHNLRPGALARYTARHATINAYVTNGECARWPNGAPMVCRGYKLTMNPNPKTT
jgi:hypothetical protein